jgi:hypothetical protein
MLALSSDQTINGSDPQAKQKPLTTKEIIIKHRNEGKINMHVICSIHHLQKHHDQEELE